VLNGREVVRALTRAGFQLDEIEGSHHVMRHPGSGRRVSVPVHGSRDVKAGTLRGIIRDAGLTVEEFCQLLV
jgi:predicted RNA binding protein YcfA (HicA-like mRNA interferase family)